MKKMILLVISFSFVLMAKKGILVKPIKEGNYIKVEVGEIVDYKDSPKRGRIDITTNDSTYSNVWYTSVIPYDKDFTPSWVFLHVDSKYDNSYGKMKVSYSFTTNGITTMTVATRTVIPSCKANGYQHNTIETSFYLPFEGEVIDILNNNTLFFEIIPEE